MSMYAAAFAWTLHLAYPAPAPAPGGLGGLGQSGGLARVDLKALAVENDTVALLNQRRGQLKQTPLQPDERLRAFARSQAEQAANGATTVVQAENALKTQNLAPLGHRLHFAYGPSAVAILGSLDKGGMKTLVESDLTRVGVGAFQVSDKPVAYQVVLLAVQDPDPMMGKSGLSAAQTDPVMQAAEKPLQACYNAALRDNPNLRGDVLLHLVIDGSGHVSGAKLLKGLRVDRFDTCLLGVAQSLAFPEPYKGKPVMLMHPMRLIPPQGDRRLGLLTGEQIQTGFRLAQDDFHTCYVDRLKALPKLAGTLTLQGVVASDGSVKAMEVLHSDTGDEALTICVLQRAKQLHFATPAQGGEVDITYPLRFGL